MSRWTVLLQTFAAVSVILGTAVAVRGFQFMSQTRQWNPLELEFLETVTAAVVVIAGLGLFMRRHWARWLWMLAMGAYGGFLLFMALLWLNYGGIPPTMHSFVAVRLGALFVGVFLLTHKGIKTLCR